MDGACADADSTPRRQGEEEENSRQTPQIVIEELMENRSMWLNTSPFLKTTTPNVYETPTFSTPGEKTSPGLKDKYNDSLYTVPFLIEKETFPVPRTLSEEVWVPGKPLRITYVSWNMAHRQPNFEDVSAYCVHPNAHIIAVCTQENGSYLRVKKDQRRWEKHVERACLQGDYTLVGRKVLWYIHLLVYARRKDVAPRIGRSAVSSVKTGFANGFGGNKGGVAVALSLLMSPSPLQVRPENEAKSNAFPDTNCSSSVLPNEVKQESLGVCQKKCKHDKNTEQLSLLFIGAHFSAHHQSVNLRNKEYRTIVQRLHVSFCGRRGMFFREEPLNKVLLPSEGRCYEEITEYVREGEEEEEEGHLVDGVNKYDNGFVDEGTDLPDKQFMPTETQAELWRHCDVTEDFDFVLFGGDLNYRINGTRKGIEHIIKHQKNIRSILAQNDQLNRERAKGVVFNGFCEGNLLFRPTYKYEIEQEMYNYTQKKDRMPAYCDRVLYKKKYGSNVGKVNMHLYTDVEQIKTSDHRPVVAIFDVETKAY